MPEHTKIVSHTPRRTRIRVSPKRRNKDEMAKLAGTIEQCPKTHGISTNLRTGSIIVYHEDGALEEMKHRLDDIGVILMSATNIDLPGGKGPSQNLTDAIADLNSRIGLSIGPFLDLKLLVPLTFGALAIWQLLRRGLQIEAAPWYMLAYIGFDSFIKLNYKPEAFLPKQRVHGKAA